MEYILTKEQFDQFQLNWKKLANKKEITSQDILIYNILRDKNADRGFTPKKTNIQGNDP